MSVPSAIHRTYSFGEFTLDLDRGALLKAGADIKLRPKSFAMLSYLVERQGLLVTKDELLGAIWGPTVVTEDAVTHCVTDIRRALHDQSHEALRTIPRRGYIFDLPVTPSGTPSRTKRSSSWTRWVSVTALVLVLGVAAAWWGLGDQAADTPATTAARSIAVLAFTDLSPEGDQEYFSDGISEELLNLLARIPGLRVAARTSSFQFKSENRDIIDIGQQLNVGHILEGSVRKSGNNLRVTAQLIKVDDGFHLWSGSYDRQLDDIFVVQDEISAAIVAALKEHLGLQVATAPQVLATANTEAHEAYLRGRFLVVQRTGTSIEGAVREFEKAIALDPDYALAHAELAVALLILNREEYGDRTLSDAIAMAKPHSEQALALDPTLAEAQAAAGLILQRQGHPEEALARYRQAIQINPNYHTVQIWMGNILLFDLGNYSESFAIDERLVRLDPLSLTPRLNYVSGLIRKNRLAEAERELDKIASTNPNFYVMYSGGLASLGGKWANALSSNLNALRMTPERTSRWTSLAMTFAAIGLEKEALAISENPRPTVLRILGRPTDAAKIAELRFAEDPNSLAGRRELGQALASAGDYAGARPILEEMWQGANKTVTNVGLFRTDSAAALIAIRRDAEKEAEVGELVAAIRENVHRNHQAGNVIGNWKIWDVDYEEGLVAYLMGEREKGLSLIAKAAGNGFFIPPSEAYLQTIYDDPGFALIRASQESRQARERDRFLETVCPDNPYAAFWKPAEGTCEQFAAARGN